MSVFRITCLALLLVCALVPSIDAQSRRVRLRPQAVQEDQLQYYEADERAGDDEDVVLVNEQYSPVLYNSRQSSRADNYIRPAAPAKAPRTKESAKAPPVQTIRNYNKVNDDGSFTFGYEAADGSFKEETRGTDCVVRGKYGYVDPDGNKREFTYVSGNPCDPNAQQDDEDDDIKENESNESPNEPANYPTRTGNYPTRTANYPTRQTTARPATTVFQNNYNQHELEAEEEAPRPTPRPRPQPSPVSITPRPQLPATTFRPQLLQITQRPQIVTQRPQVVYSSLAPTAAPSPTFATSSRPGHIDFAAEFAKFQQENTVGSSTPSTYKTKGKVGETPAPTGNPIYSTQLIYDPSSGQYNTQLFQSLPQGNGDYTLNHRVQPSVTLPRLPQQPQGFSPSPVYRHRLQQPIRNPQEVYQRQQNEQLYQNSQQLFAQQQQLQHTQLQADRQAARAALSQTQPIQQQQQQFYYVAPGRENNQGGQIDAFLRGHGIPF